MSAVNHFLREEIIKIFERHHPERTWLFEKSPPKKLANAKNSFGQLIDKDEQIILLYDDTVFGSAKNGLILTTHRIYVKNHLEKPRMFAIANIQKIVFKNLITKCLIVSLKSGEQTKISLTLGDKSIFKTLEALFPILQKELSKSKKSHPSKNETTLFEPIREHHLKCPGCGAHIRPTLNMCEYCRLPV